MYYGQPAIGTKGNFPAVMDTGSTLIAVPSVLFQSLKQEWSKQTKVDCDSDPNFCQSLESCEELESKLKPVGFLISGANLAGDTVFEINPSEYVY